VGDAAIIVDASAALALLKGEPFRKFDPEQIVGAAISAVNFSEVLAKLVSGGLSEKEADEATAALDLRVVPFDEHHARVAAFLWPTTKQLGLSLGDRACLALALALKGQAVTADKAWSKLTIGAEIIVIR
jgi:ribonuclease VapC